MGKPKSSLVKTEFLAVLSLFGCFSLPLELTIIMEILRGSAQSPPGPRCVPAIPSSVDLEPQHKVSKQHQGAAVVTFDRSLPPLRIKPSDPEEPKVARMGSRNCT